eukprot:4030281-Pyramimonas_sp.AAC.1
MPPQEASIRMRKDSGPDLLTAYKTETQRGEKEKITPRWGENVLLTAGTSQIGGTGRRHLQ